jgi:hypothetical protein
MPEEIKPDTDDQKEPTEAFQQFDDVAAKLFRVPIKEIRDLDQQPKEEVSES